jgi:predicted MFS family arabinose efflux permease
MKSESSLRIIAASSFLIFFQSYLIAPLIPSFAAEFQTSAQVVGLLVPAFLLPYGFSTLFYGPLSDRIGRKPILLTLFFFLAVTIAGFGTAHSTTALLIWRILGGVTAGGIIPIGLALLSDLFPYEKRGRAMGWVFGAIAGGMAFGSTLGAFLNPIMGWRSEFFVTAFLSFIIFIFAFIHREAFEGTKNNHPQGLISTFKGYLSLLKIPRAQKGYSYIFLNGMFHSGIFSWLGLYFSERYHLGDQGIGLALLGYGVPGMLLGPSIGQLADRVGRKKIIPIGMLIAAVATLLLVPKQPLVFPTILIAVLSLGYDMSHPLFVGIITSLDSKRRGQAMGLNAFVLFTGFGLGTLVFQLLLRSGFTIALVTFGVIQLVLGLLAVPFFQTESTQAMNYT